MEFEESFPPRLFGVFFLTLHRRDGAGFRRETLSGPDAILDLPEAGISFSLAELYRDVG